MKIRILYYSQRPVKPKQYKIDTYNYSLVKSLSLKIHVVYFWFCKKAPPGPEEQKGWVREYGKLLMNFFKWKEAQDTELVSVAGCMSPISCTLHTCLKQMVFSIDFSTLILPPPPMVMNVLFYGPKSEHANMR